VSRLAGRVALVTGASRGIGQAIAAALGREGAFVIRLARSLAATQSSAGRDMPCDITRESDVRRAAAELAGAGQAPDVLVNNAGSFLLKPMTDTTTREFRDQLDANLGGPFVVLRTFLPGMRQRRRGHVVTIGSIADHVTLPGNAAYGAAKRGLRALHETMVAELAGSGVGATLVSPAATDTTLWDAIDRRANPGLPPRSAMLKPEDVAEAVVFALTRPAGVVVEEVRISHA
jgi:NADP-dependent 3-hydroxy acid dehydrogenase YdfG